MAIRGTNIRSLAREQEYEPEDDFGADEAFLRQVVAPTPAPAPVAALAPMPGDWMSALQQQNPNWILQAIQSQPASLETGEAAGPIEGYTFYDPSKTSTSDTFKRYDVSGNLLGEQKFKTPGDIADLAIEAGVDLAPILQYTPLGPAVKAIAAINAAREGDILPAIASAAGFGGYENVAKAAQAASALKNEDYLGAVLPALQAANIEDVGGYTPKDIAPALNVARAIQNENPLALLSAASAYLPGPNMPGLFVDEDIQEGFFEPGGPGFMPTEALSPQEVQREIDSLVARYPAPELVPSQSIRTVDYATKIDPLDQLRLQMGLTPDNEGFYLADLGDTSPPATTPISAPERNAFLEANIPEPETVQQLMQQYYPELYQSFAPVVTPAEQQITVTGQKEIPLEQDAFTQYMQQYAAPAEPPGVIEGPSTIEVTGKREPVLFSEFEQPLLTAEPTPSFAPPVAVTPATPAPAPTAAPATTAASAPAAPKKPTRPAFDPNLLFLMGMLATPQQQKQQEQQQLARTVPSPFGMDLLL